MGLIHLPKHFRFSLCLWVAGGFCFCAHAAMIDGTFGFVPLGNVSYSGPDLGDATSLSLPSHGLINTIPDFYNGNPNDFSSTGTATLNVLSQVELSSLVLPLSGAIPANDFFSFSANTSFATGTSPNDRYYFDLQTLTKTSSSASSLNLFISGILHDSINGFSDTPALLSLALTQSAPGAAVDVSFSLATVAVPEPGTLGAGMGVLGVLLIGSIVSRARAGAVRRA